MGPKDWKLFSQLLLYTLPEIHSAVDLLVNNMEYTIVDEIVL
jgi:hypothetical protein